MEKYTVNELMAVATSRELRDGELGFIGVGTDGRAFTLAVGIPITAARLAQLSTRRTSPFSGTTCSARNWIAFRRI